MELTFTLAKSEGYTDSPVKNQVLKEFLEEEVKFKCKPNIAIVDVPPTVAFDEEDLNDPLIAKFMKLELVISKALDLHPTKAEELQKSVTDIRILLQDDEKRGDADSKIQSLTIYLKELLTTNLSRPPVHRQAVQRRHQTLIPGSRLRMMRPLRSMWNRSRVLRVKWTGSSMYYPI